MGTQATKPCPICKLEEHKVEVLAHSGDKATYECARCGKYTIVRTAERIAETTPFRPKAAAWIRDRHESGIDVPTINSDNLKEVANSFPDYSPSQKQLILLRNIERKTSFPGQAVDILPEFDFPLAWADREEELVFYLRSLIGRDLLSRTDGPSDLADSFAFQVQITPAGWNYLEQQSRSSMHSDQAFVAMSFSSVMKPAWENAILPTVKNAGYKPYRVDVDPPCRTNRRQDYYRDQEFSILNC